MSFLATAAILASAAAVTKATGAVIQSRQMKQAQEPYKERLGQLEQMQRTGALGLTGEEEALLLRRTADPGRALAAQRMEQQQALSEGARGSGEVLAQLTQQAEAERAAMDRAQQVAAEADIQTKRAQEAEMQALAQQLAQMETQRKVGLTQGITGAVASGLGTMSQAVAFNEMINRPMDTALTSTEQSAREARSIFNRTTGGMSNPNINYGVDMANPNINYGGQ